MSEARIDKLYCFTAKSLESFLAWDTIGHYRHLKYKELSLFSVALVPAFAYVSFLLLLYIPGAFSVKPFSFYMCWSYLLLSGFLMVWLHIIYPKDLKIVAKELASKEFDSMIFNAHIRSEIEELTGDN
jgi:hypothetical protein